MNTAELAYNLPYLGSLILSAAVFFYAWQHRKSQGANAFTWYALGHTIWIFAIILEIVSPDLWQKLLWDGIQWSAAILLIIAFPVFVVQYTNHNFKYPRRMFWISLIFPAIFFILLTTNSTHQTIYTNPRLVLNTPFSDLVYSKSATVYLFAVYRYSIYLWGMTLLVRDFFRQHDLYRVQLAVIIFGFLFILIGPFLSLANVHLAPGREWIPFTSAIGTLIVAWGLFRFRIFEIAPLAREKVFDDMIDPVVILDNQSNIIDINQSMLNLLGMNAKDVIGQPARKIFSEFQIPIKMYAQVSYARTETQVEIGGIQLHYELTVWPILNSKKQILGRVYISHDITTLKDLENELRNLNKTLESRVKARTRELSEVYDITLEGWAKALELRDKETEGHSRRVTEATLLVARQMDIPEAELEHIRRGAILHDIGKMAIPDEILRKEGELTPEERKIIEQHPITAVNLLEGISFLKRALDIPYCHHERWDGNGYPRGLKGRQIPIGARIFAVADVWDALRSERPYNGQWSQKNAVTYFTEQAGKHFDPRVVNIFLDLVEQGKI